MILPFARLPFFDAWIGFSGSIPDMYWNVYSEEQRFKWLCCELRKLVEYSNELTGAINANSEAIEELAEELEKIKDPDYWGEAFRKMVEKWIEDHLTDIYRYTIAQIYFALDNEGHLVAFIPESWNELSFRTPLDYEDQATYGHLQILLNNVVVHVEEED